MIAAPVYPACLLLSGRRCVVVGGDEVALEKAEGLLACDGQVVVIAPEVVEELGELAAAGAVAWLAREFRDSDLDGTFVVVAATEDAELNERVFAGAERRAMLVNVADVPALCNFILPAVVRNGALAIAISTAGASPALAKRIKRQVAAEHGPEYARLATLLDELRPWARATLPTYRDRKEFFEAIVDGEPDPIALLRAGDEAAVRELIARRAASRTHAASVSSASA